MTSSRALSGEKFTATISTFIVLAIVAGVLTAQPASQSPGDRLAQLQSDLNFQLDLAYRLDKGDREKRRNEFDRTMAAWQASPQSEADAALLAKWLHEAIDRSLPARREALPAPPKFGETAKVVEAPTPKSRAASPPSNPIKPSAPSVVASRQPKPSRQQSAQTSHPPVTTSLLPHVASSVEPSPPRHSIVTQPPATHVAAKPAIGSNPPAINRLPDARQPEPIAPPQLPLAQPAAVPVAVNLDELNARITGYHEGLAEVMAAAVAERRTLSLDRITELVDEVEQLAGERQFVVLYYDSLTADERQAVIAPRELGSAVKLLRSALSDATSADGDDFLRPFEADETDVAALDGRLQKLAGDAKK